MEKLVLPRGYRFAGIHAGIKPEPNRLDLGLLVSDVPAAAAGVFTQNRVTAAPVKVSRDRVPTAEARGVVICSGNANACTGHQGLEDARRMTAIVAESVGCKPEQMLVCSTGIIGRHLPMDKIEPGIRTAVRKLAEGTAAFEDLAQAILTTDTKVKVSSRSFSLHEASEVSKTSEVFRSSLHETSEGFKTSEVFRVTGFAKGAAMIGPNMATLLALVFTDAAISPDDLAAIAKRASSATFNCISVEGHTSTNDTLLFFANGASDSRSASGSVSGGMGVPQGTSRQYQGRQEALEQVTGRESMAPEQEYKEITAAVRDPFENAATAVCADLARAIAADAEGATHLVTIEVAGLPSDAEARQVAKTIAESALVKTAIFGADPNWGRFVSAAGYSGVAFEEHDVSLWLGDLLLFQAGIPQPFDPDAASLYLKNNRQIHLRLQFRLGTGRCTFWTCDLGYEYIRLNAEYTT